jgi:serine/threonine protein kinase
VWRALDLGNGQDVALKLLGVEGVGDHAAEQRFLAEGKTAHELEHPNVVKVYEYGLFPTGVPFIAMELLEGKLLTELIRQVGALSAERVLKLMMQVASAVGETHRRGWVHRDLKPDNIFVVPPTPDGREERAVLLDFGIAIHAEGREAVESKDGLGTTAYAAPEQSTGDPLGARADVYSLGVVMYQLLTGALPGNRAEPGTATVHRTTRIARPSGNAATSPVLRQALEKIVIQALSPDSKQRHVDARHLLRDLERASVHLPRQRLKGPAWGHVLRTWWWLPALIALVAGIAIALWVWGLTA